jgi:predicted GNAT superfamily acetyltransferase
MSIQRSACVGPRADKTARQKDFRSMMRDAVPADFPAILELNAESVQFLSPLSAERLDRLHRMAAYHKVVEDDGAVAAFLLAFRESSDYDSPNYAWFASRYAEFVYIDRIVAAPASRGRGFAAMLYEDIIAFTSQAGALPLTCEFDLDPPNPASMHFHARMGFHEVGTQWLYGGTKQVSMQARLPGERT